MNQPNQVLSTGQVARRLADEFALTERSLNSLLRRRVDLAPPKILGRRAWSEAHIGRLAEALRVERQHSASPLRRGTTSSWEETGAAS